MGIGVTCINLRITGRNIQPPGSLKMGIEQALDIGQVSRCRAQLAPPKVSNNISPQDLAVSQMPLI